MSDTVLALQDVVVLRHTDSHLLGLFGARPIRALGGISLDIGRGETLGVMGGSGSGKTTLAEVATLRLPLDRGEVTLLGQKTAKLKGDARKKVRRRLQIVRQDARDSLDMELTALAQLQAQLRHHGLPEDEARVVHALAQVGLGPELARRTPLQMSGGQQQRLAIARALILNPVLVALDEPVSGVDPHLQRELLELLQRVQREQNLAYLLISHDRRVISRLAHRTAMLCAGRLVELAPTERLLSEPRHPYSRYFLGFSNGGPAPDEDQAGQSLAGCPWAADCPVAKPACQTEAPAFRTVAPGHVVACHDIEK